MSRLVIALLLALVLLAPAFAQGPDPTPTAIPVPTTTLQLTNIVSTTQQLADDQAQAWALDGDTAGWLVGLAALVVGCWFFPFLRELARWR